MKRWKSFTQSLWCTGNLKYHNPKQNTAKHIVPKCAVTIKGSDYGLSPVQYQTIN